MDRYLHSFYDGQKIYYLNKEGREQVNCKITRTKITTADHYLMRNDLYIFLKQPSKWQNEIKITSGEGKKQIIAVTDAHFTRNGKHYLVEIDNTQKMNKNIAKIERYRRLIERNAFKGMPVIIWVTTSTYRQKELKRLSEGLEVKCFLNTDIQ